MVYLLGGLGMSWICVIILRSDTGKFTINPHYSKFSVCMNIVIPILVSMMYLGILLVNQLWEKYEEEHPDFKDWDP